ncbi:DNA-lyase 2 [Lipomyces japonicus]|uniref:DNA-lyase 2 n=1 Tax=Lipomyces japonicus TaxID=56871 RepID=UPI0034CDC6E1
MDSKDSTVRLRIVTFNICGIRNVLQYHPWNTQKTFMAMFDLLKADIICFQETKIQSKDLSEEMALVPGFDSFFSFANIKKGYSGVAIYCRSSICRPYTAEEGITGSLYVPASRETYRESPKAVGGYDYTISNRDALQLDSEGRSIILDFKIFVLIGVYCPANASKDRDGFREKFLEVLFDRIRKLVTLENREVVLIGDLNVIRDEIDTADIPEIIKEGNLRSFKETNSRKLLDELLMPHDKGILVDLCRQFHPNRQGMYTCWNQKLNARPANYGSRIDYVLASKGLSGWCKKAEIRPDLLGSDHCPVFADIYFPLEKASELVSDENSLPALASKLLPQFMGRQSIKTMFNRMATSNIHSLEKIHSVVQSHKILLDGKDGMRSGSMEGKRKLKSRCEISGREQKRLTQFFRSDPSSENTDESPALIQAQDFVSPPSTSRTNDENVFLDNGAAHGKFLSPKDPRALTAETKLENADVIFRPLSTEWRKIFRKRQAPQCDVHNEPCVQRVTKKAGANLGRVFWICSRPVGPGHQTTFRNGTNTSAEFRCRYFKWDSEIRGKLQ